MRTIHDWSWEHDYDAMREQGMYNPPTRITLQGKDKVSFLIGAGSRDEITILAEGTGPDRRYYVVCVNHGLAYAGVEIFNVTGEPAGDMFLQYDHEVADILGPRGVGLTPITIAKRLAQYIDG